MKNNPPIKLTNEQFFALNRAVAVAEVSIRNLGYGHHDKTIREAREVLSRCEVDPISFDLASVLAIVGQDQEAA